MSELTGSVKIIETGDERKIYITPTEGNKKDSIEYMVDPVSELTVEDGQLVAKGDKLTEGHLDLGKLINAVGPRDTQKYVVNQVQKVYASQGVALNDKHIEVIVSKMFNNFEVLDAGDTELMRGNIVTVDTFRDQNASVIAQGGDPAKGRRVLLGITKAALNTDSFLSAASFIYTSRVLTDAACSGKVDKLFGLKENVIIGNLIPTDGRARLE